MKRRYFISVDRETKGRLHSLQFDLSSLTPKQAEVYRMYYEDGMTMRRIGKEKSIHFTTVQEIITAIKKKALHYKK